MSDVETRLRQVRQAYIDGLSAKLEKIHELWDEIKSANFAQANSTQQDAFYSLVHGISGSGATFGFEQLTNTAKPLERLFKQLQGDVQPAREHVEQIDTLVCVLQETIQNINLHPGEFNTDVFLYAEETPSAPPSNNKVYILDDDNLLAEGFSAQLVINDYEPVTFPEFETLGQALTTGSPLAVIIGSRYLLDHNFSAQLAEIRQDHSGFSVFCLSDIDNMSARIDALRAGADCFFAKPLDSAGISNALDTLIGQEQAPLYRVLIIDDDKILASLYATYLERARIQVEIINDPRQALEKINVFKPELILLDIHMQHIGGFEVARVIRQLPELDIISIIFMSTEQDMQRQLVAIDHVGDFLKKPIWPEHLVTTALSKCRHARKLIQTQNKLQDTLREYEFQKQAMDLHSIISITDANGDITYVNSMFCDISGLHEAELIGKNHRITKSDEHDNKFYENMWKTITNGQVWHGEIKNRSNSGDDYWVESTIVPFLDDQGIPYQYVSIRTDITKIKNAEQEQIQRQHRLQEQNTSLAILSNKEKLYLKNKTTAYKTISREVSETLHIARTRIWLYDKQKNALSSEFIYDSNNNEPDSNPQQDIASFPVFIGTLIKQRIVVANDALSSPLTKELTKEYLLPMNIKSMMTAGIYNEGICIGAICCEAIGEIRTWWPEDKNYLTTIADFIALLIEQWERQSIQDQLVIAKDNAEKANKAKSEFLSRMSHELRTPLNAIIGFSQLIEIQPENLSATQKDSISEILHAGRHLLELINEVLDLSAIESGKMQVTVEPVNLQQIIHECLQLISPLTNKKSITIINNIPETDKILCQADYNKAKQVLINLLSNAIKYNINDGKIFISSDSDDATISIIIEDTGYGIPDAKMKNLFIPFERSGSEYNHIEGTGIGLAISKNLMELMGGHIGCSSTVGAGSKFWVKLPKHAPD